MALVRLETSTEEINYYSKNIINNIYIRSTSNFSSAFYIFLILSIFSPFLALTYLLFSVFSFYSDFLKEIFSNKKKFIAYNSMFQIQVRRDVLSIVGYRVEEHELDEHIAIVKNDDKKALGLKQKKHLNIKHKHVGLDKGTLTTHIALIGKTGSGKTEGIRSLSDDIMRIGGGYLFNDGKSDTGMLTEVLNQAKRCGRETSVMVINFLKAESMAETNTFNMLSIMHPVKIVEFLGNLVMDGGGKGNEAYFFNRGKAMLFPVVAGLSIRNKVADEGMSFEQIAEYKTLNNMNMLWITFYCMSRDINEIIKNNRFLRKKLDSVIVIKENKNFEYIEKIIDYVIQKPTEKNEIEEHLGFEYTLIKEIYNNVYSILKSYMGEVWNQYSTFMNPLCKIIYIIGKKEGLIFFDEDFARIAKISEIKLIYTKVRDQHEHPEILNDDYNLFANGVNELDLKQITLAFKENPKGNLEDAPSNAVQQHAYAEQQWTVLFSLFIAYKHVFGQGKSEIDPQKILTDNKILYILLPPLELAEDQVKILGKIILMTIKEVAGIALGGKEISIHETLKNIRKDMITPKPFTLVVLDEYGAYPIAGLATLLAQVRSINLSLVLGIQDMASLKANGDDITSQERALANLMKWILKVEDKTTKEWMDSMLEKIKVRVQSSELDAHGNLVSTASSQLEERDVLHKSAFMNFNNGFSAMIAGSDPDKIVYVQTFFRGGETGTVFIKRFNNINFD
ncbi:TraM recognition domain-containing protein [Aliarcobacter butzleri]|uniref:TraM recognition domain-containing protein n=1 Tax=Aliarcobacter butzleri TaxID=28197 RepID=UPI001269C169|nr:TraM recognition domain-containing protein [Aliarcobacter butzleri]